MKIWNDIGLLSVRYPSDNGVVIFRKDVIFVASRNCEKERGSHAGPLLFLEVKRDV